MKKYFTLMVMALLSALSPALAETWEVTWPAGGSASSIDDVQIKCTEVAYRYLADDATATLSTADGTLVKTLVRDDITLSYKGSYCTVDFEFNPALTAEGTYNLQVPQGTFTTTDGDENAAFTVTFTVAASSYTQVDVNFTCISPEGGKGTSLEYIILSSGDTWDVVTSTASGAIYNASFTEVATLSSENVFAYEGNIMVALSPAITTPGSYMLVLNEGSIVSTSANITNNMTTVELTVTKPEPTPVTWEVTWPAGGSASSVDDVQIKCTEVAYRYLADDATATLSTTDGTLVKTLVRDDITLSYKGSYCTVDFEFNPALTAEGTYNLQVPQGTFTTTDGDENAAFTVTFTVAASSYTQVDVNFTCVSPEGGKGTSLEYIILSSGDTWDVVTSTASGAIYNASFTEVATLSSENVFVYEGNIMVALSPAITTTGSYMLVLNEGSIVSTSANITNNMTTVELTVTKPEPTPVTWEVTWPAGGSASSVDDVQIKCTEVAYRYLADDATATLSTADGTLVKTLVRDDITLSYKGSYCTVDFEFNPALTTEGTYNLQVPQGTFTTTDGDENAAFTVTFTVAASSYTQVDVNFTCISPEGGKGTSLEYILLSSGDTWDVVTSTASGVIYNASFTEVATLSSENVFAYEGNIMVVLSPAITTPGSYMLILNEGSIVSTSANITNNMTTVELTVTKPEPTYEIVAMPADGATVSSTTGVPSIYLSITGYKFVAGNSEGIEATVTKDGADYAVIGSSDITASMDLSSAVITLPADRQMTTDGQYVVEIPEGFFTMADKETGDIVSSPAITLHYTVNTPAESLSWTISPAPGEVDRIDVVTLTFNKPVKAAISKYVGVFYTDYSYLPETVTEGIISVSDDGLTATIDFQPVFTDGGIYQIRLYEGEEQLAVVDGETFPGINITYKVTGALYTVCTPEEGSEVEMIDQVKVKLPRNTKVSATDDFSAYFTVGGTRVDATLASLVPYDMGDPTYLVVKANEEITTPGEVTLVIEAGSLNISNYGETMLSPEIRASFTVMEFSGIDNLLLGSETAADVYDLSGRRVLTGASAADIQRLRPGCYIAGGRKIMVK